MVTLSEALALAIQHHQAGRLQAAEQIYRQILQAEPNHADALHLLGVIAYQVGKPEFAIEYIERAIRFRGNVADFHSNLAGAYRALGRIPEVVACLRRALELKPDYAEAHNNLGIALTDEGKLDEAVACLRRALKLKPDYAEAHNNLGAALKDQGKLDEAVACYRRALARKPDYAEARSNLGAALKEQGKLEEAVACYRQAIEQKPDYAEAHNNLGTALTDQGKLEEAVACYRRALALKPDYATAHRNLGAALKDQGKPDDAVACYRRALELKPDYAEAHNNLGAALKDQGKLDEAVACYRRALEMKPDHATAHSNLGVALKDQGKLDEAVACYRRALELKPDFAKAHSNLLFALNHDPDTDLDALFAEHRRWETLHARAARLPAPVDRDKSPERRLRIGYVSPDLRRHALSRYLEPVLAHHDRQQVEVFCYAEVTAPDDMTARLQALSHHWRWTCGHPAATVAEWIRADEIDVLVDLAGHTANNRLDVFALKPAPVQVTWLGYMNTTGLHTMDYRLTDGVVDPPGQPVRDTEELYRVQGGMCCFAPPEDAPAVSPLPARRTGHLTFGSLHRLAKLNPTVFDLWSRVLRALPGARLLMFRETLVGETREFICRQFTERGIAADRLDLRQGSSAAGYLGVYDAIDVTLDVFPYTGGTTTCESLWMGAPVLSLAGQRPAGRSSAGLLACVGLDDWVVTTPEVYVALAVRCAGDLEALAASRAGLRARMGATLCDARRFTRVLEEGYRSMWRRWCAGVQSEALG